MAVATKLQILKAEIKNGNCMYKCMYRKQKSTYKFLIKMEDLYAVQKEMILFLKSLGDIFPNEIKSAFRKLHKKLLVYENHPYERRAFLYLDIISWLESKIENKSIGDIIKEKFTKLNALNINN